MPARPARVAIVVPTADPSREPARTAIARARQTTKRFGDAVSIHPIVSSGPEFRFSRSVNRGMGEVPDADAWVLLNDDCFMDDGWLEAMLDTVRRHPEVGLVGAVLRFPGGRLQHAGAYFKRPLPYLVHNALANRAPLWAWRQVRRLAGKQAPLSGHYHRVDPRNRLGFLTGACLLITRACRARIGDFDERYRFGFEDLDYSLRALEAGFELALAVEATGTHIQTATGGGMGHAWQEGEHVFLATWPRPRAHRAVEKDGRRGVYHGHAPPASCACASSPAPAAPARSETLTL